MGERHQKRNVGLLICVIVLCIAVVCLAVWLIKDRMHGKESFEDVILNLEFDDKEDLYWVENISSKELLRMQKNGHIHFDSDGPREFILKYRIKGGELVHYRVRNAESGPSFFAGLSYGTAGSKSEMQQIRFIPNSFSPVSCIYMVDFMDGGEPLGSWEGEFQGSAIMNTGQWHDVIYYLPEDADSVYVILSDEEQDKIAYLSFVLPEDWRHEDWQLMLNPFFDEGVSGQSVDLDFVRVSDSTLSDYLKNHISSYQTHKERLDQFLAKEADQIPVLSNQEQEETTGDESQAREEEADEQNGGPAEIPWEAHIDYPAADVAIALNDQTAVYGEDAEDMMKNQGGSFGQISEKKAGDGYYEFLAYQGEPACMPMYAPLDSFYGMEQGGNQAILVKFQSNAVDPCFSLKAGKEYGIRFGADGVPAFWQEDTNSMEKLPSNVTLNEGEWYYLLMAIDKNGTFRSILWPEQESEQKSYANRDLGDENQNGSWNFLLTFAENGSIKIGYYVIFTYESLTPFD